MIKKLIKNLLQKKNIYSLDKEKKKSIFDKALKSLTLHHKKNCKDYSLFIKNISNNKKKKIPALHANVFKKKKLISVNDEKIISELNSSGTTGNEKSKIYIDLATAKIQKKVLSRIFNSYVAREKCSIVFICEQPKQGSKKFSAREAGVLGFSTFSKNRFFMVKDEKIN
jgi:phenylacetate-coenzyme A ligase PaaK-like adenylate-forming protein